jgi:hypothetical protein
MESEDGVLFVKVWAHYAGLLTVVFCCYSHLTDNTAALQNLANFVRTHERALANALQSQYRLRNKDGKEQVVSGGPASPISQSAPTSTSLTELLSRPYFSLASRTIKPAKLTLTPHHLYYLLDRFEDLGVDVGPMKVRLENLHGDAGPMNYVSFLGNAPKSKGRQADSDSLRSVSSIRSVMSSVSSVWSNLTMSNSAAKAAKQMSQNREDLTYLYSCFTKIPALRLAPDHRARLVAGFEEFPFDTAVPLFAFKNLSALEICDLDFRQFHGWDRLAEQLRTLTVKRAGVEDPFDLLYSIVLDDAERRRKRSSKTQVPTTPSTPGVPWPTVSPKSKQVELARSLSSPIAIYMDQRRGSTGSPNATTRTISSEGKRPVPLNRQPSNSPPRATMSRNGSASHPHRPHTGRSQHSKNRRSSGSSESSTHETTPRHSASDLMSFGILPPSKWRFLRHLSLAENSLTHLFASSLAPVANTLHSLDLSGNLFSEIPDALASLTHLRALNLSNCMIDSLQSLSRNPLPAITTLNLRSNRLHSLAGIERLYSLERLDLRDNKLHDPTELARLTGIPDIIDLYVIKNPFTRTHGNYRVTIFNLFRSTPGHVDDVTIDTLGPLYNEKKYLVDRVFEPAYQKPVIQPPLEDDDGPLPSSPIVAPMIHDHDRTPPSSEQFSHRRSTSDVGPRSTARRRKVPRRRIVELSQADFPRPAQQEVTPAPADPPVPELTQVHPMPRTPKGDSEPPEMLETPGTTPRDTETPVQPIRPPLAVRPPKLDTAFASPPNSPKIRDLSDNDNSPIQALEDDLENLPAMFRQKIDSLQDDHGSNWLSALHEGKLAGSGNKTVGGVISTADRDYSPASTIRTEQASRSVSVGARTLG